MRTVRPVPTDVPVIASGAMGCESLGPAHTRDRRAYGGQQRGLDAGTGEAMKSSHPTSSGRSGSRSTIGKWKTKQKTVQIATRFVGSTSGLKIPILRLRLLRCDPGTSGSLAPRDGSNPGPEATGGGRSAREAGGWVDRDVSRYGRIVAALGRMAIEAVPAFLSAPACGVTKHRVETLDRGWREPNLARGG